MAEPTDPWHQERVQRAIRQAIQRPDRYLAALFAGETDDGLAAAVGAAPHLVWRLRLATHPRPAWWAIDIQALALAIEGDPALLDAYLRGRGLGPPV